MRWGGNSVEKTGVGGRSNMRLVERGLCEREPGVWGERVGGTLQNDKRLEQSQRDKGEPAGPSLTARSKKKREESEKSVRT